MKKAKWKGHAFVGWSSRNRMMNVIRLPKIFMNGALPIIRIFAVYHHSRLVRKLQDGYDDNFSNA